MSVNPEGFTIIGNGMRSLIGCGPPDYRVEAVARRVVGELDDVLALLPTGAGQTVIFVMAIHVLIKMNADPTWSRSYSMISMWVLDNPTLIAILYPTNTLAEEQAAVPRTTEQKK